MKAHFLKMFDYDKYANLLILESILAMSAPEKPVQLMAHLLASQQIWLNRCKGLPAVGGALWPDWKAETFEGTMEDNHLNWADFINQLEPVDFKNVIAYQNSKGESFENQLSDVLAHVINHGTHHRAQAGQHLKLAGLKQLPVTDYIFYLRNKGL
ncbi:DinB family protein [Mucilaginibacter arboris]|uniref:Damage-inducible protein DinB n=1 Tax=Mucilaginibacter arboris TaxID=2682090 RepID=A0A7K1T176_9SPHI|nr:DinB family protein [Mucilaginibacter arboris]MVN23305.1 hypothetical protein [Mucilaginibacter arboris]